MTARPFDDAAIAFDNSMVQFDGCLLVNFDDPTVAFNEPLIDFNGCDNRVAVTATTGSIRQYREYLEDPNVELTDDEEAIAAAVLLLL